MNSAQRAFKKMTILLVVFSFIAAIAYVLFKPKTPACFNGVLDVGEEQIDCGGFCAKACPIPDKPDYVKDIKINWTQFVEDGRNNYDFVTSLSNENTSWGVRSVNYTFTYFDEGGNELGKKEGTISIMPRGDMSDNSLKYLIEEDVASNAVISRVDFKLSDFDWEEVVDKDDVANLNENVIEILDKNFEMNTNKKVYIASGKTKNTSVYDFVKVDINAVLFGPEGQLVAAGKTDQLTMIAGDGWGFEVSFPNLKGRLSEVAKIDLRAETDVFDENNFMKEYRVQD